MLKKFFKDERGQDMIEYGLLASFISIVSLATIKLIGPLVAGLYDSVIAAMS
jgi:Flp pilus assembly pilin Flp